MFEHINLIPKDAHGCDFSRVRSYTLDGKLSYIRQNIIVSQHQHPELNALAHRFSKNVAGSIKMTHLYPGSLSDVVLPIPQVYHRVPAGPIQEAANTRFDFFIKKMLPTLRQGTLQKSHTLIVVPSYFDFVRIKNYLESHNYNYDAISEYTELPDVDRARHYFKSGETKFLIYSERAHFFRRYKITGAAHVVFYQPPLPHFYTELVNQIKSDNEGTCSVLFSAYDKIALERIVGTSRVGRMLKSDKEAFMFTS